MDGFTIVVDSREQLPYVFDGAVVKALPSGDYSLLGLENKVAIERKSRCDAYSSLGRNRARFRREVERLAALDFAAIVVEDTLPGFLRTPPAYSMMNPRAAICSLLAWSVRYRVPVHFAGDREHARALTQKLLQAYWRYGREVRDERTNP